MRTLVTLLVLSLASCSITPRPRVLLIGIDGCRPDALVAARTPALDGLRANGATALDAQTCARTSSGPSWTSLLTGVWPAKHRVVDNEFEGARLDAYGTVFARVEQHDPELVTLAVSQWEPIHTFLAAPTADLSEPAASSSRVAERAIELLRDTEPDLLFLHFDDVDHAGHEYGYDSEIPEYRAAVEATDAEIARVLEAVRERRFGRAEDWLVVVTTDHGGSGQRHGMDVPEHRTIFLIVSGSAAQRGDIAPAPSIVDATATVLAHLRIPIDAAWKLDGRPVGLVERQGEGAPPAP